MSLTMTPEGVEHFRIAYQSDPPHGVSLTMTPEGVEHFVRTLVDHLTIECP